MSGAAIRPVILALLYTPLQRWGVFSRNFWLEQLAKPKTLTIVMVVGDVVIIWHAFASVGIDDYSLLVGSANVAYVLPQCNMGIVYDTEWGRIMATPMLVALIVIGRKGCLL